MITFYNQSKIFLLLSSLLCNFVLYPDPYITFSSNSSRQIYQTNYGNRNYDTSFEKNRVNQDFSHNTKHDYYEASHRSTPGRSSKIDQNDNSFWDNNTSPTLLGIQERTETIIHDPTFLLFSAQTPEYKALHNVYRTYTPSLYIAIEKRSNVFSAMISGNYAVQYGTRSYDLNNNAKQLLSKYGYDAAPFTYCYGNQLHHAIHQESLDILGRINNLPSNSVLHDHQEALIDFSLAMAEYNHAGLIDKAMQIGDLCWTLLDYGQAIAEGIALGAYCAIQDIFTHPIETTVSIVAGKQVLAYQLCKVLYNVADIGMTALSNNDRAKEKWDNYTAPLQNIIDAINKKEITVRNALKGGTAFVVGYKAQGKLLGGLGKFCGTIKKKSIGFVKNNSLLSPQEYSTTPEGLLFKATSKSSTIKLSGQTNVPSKLKSVIDNKVTKATVLPKSPITGKGIIRNDLKAKIQAYKGHIFSDDHKNRGILGLGKSEEAIMDSLYKTIISLDNKALLREGANQIKATINGVNNVEVRCFIQNGQAISVNAYISNFGRIYGHFIDTTKV